MGMIAYQYILRSLVQLQMLHRFSHSKSKKLRFPNRLLGALNLSLDTSLLSCLKYFELVCGLLLDRGTLQREARSVAQWQAHCV